MTALVTERGVARARRCARRSLALATAGREGRPLGRRPGGPARDGPRARRRARATSSAACWPAGSAAPTSADAWVAPKLPVVLGHELTGEVVAVGAEVRGRRRRRPRRHPPPRALRRVPALPPRARDAVRALPHDGARPRAGSPSASASRPTWSASCWRSTGWTPSAGPSSSRWPACCAPSPAAACTPATACSSSAPGRAGCWRSPRRTRAASRRCGCASRAPSAWSGRWRWAPSATATSSSTSPSCCTVRARGAGRRLRGRGARRRALPLRAARARADARPRRLVALPPRGRRRRVLLGGPGGHARRATRCWPRAPSTPARWITHRARARGDRARRWTLARSGEAVKALVLP